MNEKKISANIEKLNKKLLKINDKLIKKLEKYQLQYEIALNNIDFDLNHDRTLKNTIKNFNKAQSIKISEDLAVRNIALDYVSDYDKLADYQKKFNADIGINIENFNFDSIPAIKYTKTLDFNNLYTTSVNLDVYVKKQLINAIALNSPLKLTIKNLSKELLGAGDKVGELAKYAETYMRTSLFGLSRLIDQELYNEQGYDKFIYAGVISDGKIRPFCAAHVGREFTKEQINKFPEENKSGLNPYFAPGGWNCRHRMIPVINE